MRKIAIEAALKAGKLLLKLSKSDISYKMKNPLDILTEADLKSEQIIISTIKKKYPDHSFFAEESGESNLGSEYLWIIDPLDGTINYANGLEEYCISIALEKSGKLQLGVVYQPVMDRLFVAEKGKGAFLNEQSIKVSSKNKLIDSIVATDNTSKTKVRKKIISTLGDISDRVRQFRIMGSAALHLSRTSTGQIDLYFKPNFNYWDVAAGILLVQEAGGKVTDYSGRKVIRSSKSIVASNSELHKEFLEIIK